MKNSLLMMGVFLLSFTAHAGNERGNGGDAVVCRSTSGAIVSAELLDYYEGRHVRGLIAKFDPKVSNETYLKSVAKRLNGFDPEVFSDFEVEAKKINKAIQSFKTTGSSSVADIVFTDEELIDIPDTGNLLLKPGCGIEQLAIRVNKVFVGDPTYLINSLIVKSLNDRDLLGLVLHEAIYRAFVLNLKAENSVAARYLNQVIASKEITTIPFGAYVETAQNVNNRYSIKRGNRDFSSESMETMPDGSIRVWDMNSDLHLVLDTAGILNYNKSLKWGGVRVIPHWDLITAVTFGKVIVSSNGTKQGEWSYNPFASLSNSRSSYDSVLLPFGKWEVKIVFGKESRTDGTNFGIDYEFLRSSDGKPLLINTSDDDGSVKKTYIQTGDAVLSKNFKFDLINVKRL